MSREPEPDTDPRPDDEASSRRTSARDETDVSPHADGVSRRGDGGSPSRRDALRAGLAGLGALAGGCTDLRLPEAVTGGPSGQGERPTGRDETPDTSAMELVLEDRFEADRLDTSTWRDKYPWDARTHNYDGFAAPENVSLANGKLVLEATDEPRGGREYTTGVVSAKEVFEPGYFEASIRVPPHVPGFWPAYWLTSASEHPPEIDIFEFFGTDRRAHMTYHFTDSDGEEEKVREMWGDGFADRFHTYSVDWDPPEKIVWYVDGVERFRYEGDQVSDEYCYLILNFGIDRPGDPPPRSRDLPATYEVDWLRCWER